MSVPYTCGGKLGGRRPLAVEAEDAEVTTVEGFLHGEELGEVQQAFRECDGFQCGYCNPGQIMAVESCDAIPGRVAIW